MGTNPLRHQEKDTRIVAIAHYDNSANNKYNPDLTKLIFWGQQNWNEMQNCFMGFLVDPQLKDPLTLFKASGPSLLRRSTSGPILQSLIATAVKQPSREA